MSLVSPGPRYPLRSGVLSRAHISGYARSLRPWLPPAIAAPVTKHMKLKPLAHESSFREGF